MEAVWTLFFPAFLKARELIAAGEIGQVHFGRSDFGIDFPRSIPRIWDPNLAGGSLLDIGVYPITLLTVLLGGMDETLEIKATGVVEQGVDIFGSVTIKFPNNKMAIASWHSLVKTEEETVIIGTKGYIKLHSPSHCPTQLTLTRHSPTLGQSSTQTFSFPIPPPATCTTPFNFVGSNGFQYEAIAVQACVARGERVSQVLPPEVSVRVMGVMDEVRRQVGLKYPFE